MTKWAVGMRVRHKDYGVGTVEGPGVQNNEAKAHFPDHSASGFYGRGRFLVYDDTLVPEKYEPKAGDKFTWGFGHTGYTYLATIEGVMYAKSPFTVVDGQPKSEPLSLYEFPAAAMNDLRPAPAPEPIKRKVKVRVQIENQFGCMTAYADAENESGFTGDVVHGAIADKIVEIEVEVPR